MPWEEELSEEDFSSVEAHFPVWLATLSSSVEDDGRGPVCLEVRVAVPRRLVTTDSTLFLLLKPSLMKR
ncbi:hypothetical protein PanWU01x14_229580 [Parasponia andersonii]|uniref:Uncharacterized protein n=1 Tax=Parasponia andersonii TaxID=3476 RepID=A0A2P5BL86_PARAD|nr:hypothetical protein PanWU01x14_229580 [Parasponia andersonii]